ncbi:MAG: type IV-A pilus assembly ATPase PilB [Gammaproteobacteria bacterium]|nr:type IV-A pilus assembly ATPase PilB [Gammaproteobacteria bacterium]
MATPDKVVSLGGLAQRLIRDGVLDAAAAEDIQAKALKKSRSFYVQLAESKAVDSLRLVRAASEEFGIPLLDIGAFELENAPMDLIDSKILEKHRVLPLYKRGTKLFVATSDPANSRAIEEIKFHTGLGVEPILIEPSKLESALDAAQDTADTSLADLETEEGLDDIDVSAEEDVPGGDDVDVQQIDTPVVRFVNKMLLDAIKRGASDIHLEPYEKKYRVRFRVDGVLHEMASPPVNLAGRISARVKILSRLDIAERRVPQDGRMKLTLSKNRSIDFRVSTLPTIYGEKVVIRLLDAAGNIVNADRLGFEPDQRAAFDKAINFSYGMILVTGPTGSGKTVTLYTALNALNNPERNICTVEDPVEINMMGINQVNINDRANLTFATALRAFLRQDPDVIMVGEIRDLETADIAIKASQTGHLVLSTLHTNDAPATLTRLLNMGVAPFNVASAVHLIMAQRLARKLCESCKEPIDIPEHALRQSGFTDEAIAEGVTVHTAKGCDRCTLGYKGRVGIFQMMPLTEEMGELIMEGANQYDIEQQAAKEGVLDLRQAGLLKVRAGVTSLEEVERVTNI